MRDLSTDTGFNSLARHLSDGTTVAGIKRGSLEKTITRIKVNRDTMENCEKELKSLENRAYKNGSIMYNWKPHQMLTFLRKARTALHLLRQ